MYPKATEGQEGYCDIEPDKFSDRAVRTSKALKTATRTGTASSWGWCSANCWTRIRGQSPLAIMLQIAHIHVIKPEDCVRYKSCSISI